jgi:hypothetical protein
MKAAALKKRTSAGLGCRERVLDSSTSGNRPSKPFLGSKVARCVHDSSDDNDDDNRASPHLQLYDNWTRIVLGRTLGLYLPIRRSIGSKQAADRSIRRGTEHHWRSHECSSMALADQS